MFSVRSQHRYERGTFFVPLDGKDFMSEQKENTPRPRRYIDSWTFYPLLGGFPESLSPTDNNGFVRTRESWNDICKRVDLFFSIITDEQIEKYNNDLNDHYENEEKQRHIEYKQQEKEKKSSKKEGYIYLLHSEVGYYKIGKAVDPWSRGQTIGTEHAYKVNLIYVARCTDRAKVERLLHQTLAEYRMNGEWFNLPPDKVEWLIYHDWIDDLSLRAIVTDCERMPQ